MSLYLTQFVIPLCLFAITLFWNKDRPWPSWVKLLLSLAVCLIAFLILAFVQREAETKTQHWVVAGTVEDEATHEGVGQADVLLEGFNSPYKTEENGNFRIELKGKIRQSERLRIRVSKAGYKPFDATLTPPKDDFIVPLQKL
jgi:4-amino-4-deoxy-L-arabinose transferase-like glycosyltransferase